VSAVIVTGTFFFFSKTARLSLLEQAIFFPCVIFLENSVLMNSFRGQQIHLLFLGVLFFVVSRYKSLSKLFFLIPFLFFVWVNLYRESILALLLFGLWIGCFMTKIYFSKKEKKHFLRETRFLLGIFFISFFVTLINPFGFNTYLSAFAHFNNASLNTVNEYLPLFAFSASWWAHLFVLGLLLFSIRYFFIRKKFIEYLPIYLIPLILLLLAFDVRRYAWSAYFLVLPVFHLVWLSWEKHSKKYAFYLASVVSIISIIIVGYTKLPLRQFTDMSWDTFYVNRSLPITKQSAEFLVKHKLTENLFTFYNWGGYLIWNYPEIKPSVDGRMSAWRDEKGYSAYEEYLEYVNGQKAIDDSSYDVVYIPMERAMPLYQELNDLVSRGKWKLVYRDDYVGIIMRNKRT
jgi:hypothetical protein